MSKHDQWLFRVRHIVESIQRINTYVEGIDLPMFVQNRMMREAIERNFEIIGEAVTHISDDIQNKYPVVPWRKMKSMRNFIIHQYDEVEEVALWNTIHKDLPTLLTELTKILRDAE